MAFCRNCGAQVNENENFCSSCGARIELTEAQQAAQAAAATAAAVAAPAAEQASPAPQAPVQGQQEAPAQQAFPQQQYNSPQYAQQAVYAGPEQMPYYAQAPVPDADAIDTASNKGMAALSYIGVLVLIPLFARSGSRFARFHINQGLVLMFAELIVNVGYRVISAMYHRTNLNAIALILYLICAFVFFILSIIGIVHAAKGQYKKLPILGGIDILK